MRNLIVFALTCVIALAFLATPGAAQKVEPKKAEDPEKVLAELLKNVKQKDNAELRVQAIMGLADFGVKAEPALPDLLDALQTKNEDLRLNAAITLAKIGTPAVKPVAKLLSDDSPDTKFYALWTIGWIGPEAKETLPTIIKLMNDKDGGVRRKAAFALGRIAGDPDRTISVLVDAFKDEDDDVRGAAGDALAKFGKPAVPALIGLLKAENPKARMQASTSLGEIGADAKDAAAPLKDLFLSTDTGQNVHHYAQILGKLGKAGVPALEAGFKDARPQVRQAAAQALQQVGADAVGVLVDGLGDKSVEVRRLAAQTLSPMRIGDKSVVIALAFALTDEDDNVRQNCMNGLVQLGAQAKLGSAKIKDALTDMNPTVRQQAYHLLQQLGENPGETLKKALQSKDDKLRINTASLMVQVNFETNTAFPVLIDALKNNDLGLRMQAAFTLAQRQQQTDKVMPIFLEGLKHKASGVRMQAVQGLSVLRNGNSAVALAETLKDPDANVRQQAVYALQNVRGAPETIVPILTRIYTDGDAEARRTVLQVAWVYGPKAKDLIATGLRDKEAGVRQQAIASLQNLQGDLSEMLPTLVMLMNDKELGVRQNLVWLFQRTGAKGVPHLAGLLKDSDANIRSQAIQVLRNMGPKVAAEALPAIKEATKDSSPNVRMNAMLLVATMGGEPPDFFVKAFQSEKDANLRSNLLTNLTYSGQQKISLLLLKPAMSDSSPQVRQTTINLIGFFGQNSKEGFEIFTLGLKDTDNGVRTQAAYQANFFGQKSWPALEDSLKTSKDSGFRQAILQGLLNTQYRSKTSVPLLTDCLKDGNPTVRHLACNILGNIGADAADALPQLRELTKDANPGVQAAAKNAVQRIEVKK